MLSVSTMLPISVFGLPVICTFTYTLLVQFLASFNLQMSNRHTSFLHLSSWQCKLVLPLWFSSPCESSPDPWWLAALRKHSSSQMFCEVFGIWVVPPEMLWKKSQHRLKKRPLTFWKQGLLTAFLMGTLNTSMLLPVWLSGLIHLKAPNLCSSRCINCVYQLG